MRFTTLQTFSLPFEGNKTAQLETLYNFITVIKISGNTYSEIQTHCLPTIWIYKVRWWDIDLFIFHHRFRILSPKFPNGNIHIFRIWMIWIFPLISNIDPRGNFLTICYSVLVVVDHKSHGNFVGLVHHLPFSQHKSKLENGISFHSLS